MKLGKFTNRLLFLPPTVQAEWENESSRNDFEHIKTLGKGSFGLVWQARHKKTGNIYAIKQIKKKSINAPKLLLHVKTEVRIMYLLNHPHIIKLYNHFQDDFSIYFVLEFAQKGQLYRYMMSQCPQKRLTEQKASLYIKQIVQALGYIHERNIIHRDIKPQNILIDREGNLKLADFGWSNFVEQLHSKRETYCGTLDYLAPQMIEATHKHDYRVDIWSVGVLIYELINGFGPFSYELLKSNCMSQQRVKQNIVKVKYSLPSSMSEQAKDLVSKILVKQVQQRLTLENILNHQWILMHQPKDFKQLHPQKEWQMKLKKEFQLISSTPSPHKNQLQTFTKQEIYKSARVQGILNKKIDQCVQRENQKVKKIEELQLRIRELELNNKVKDQEVMSLKKANQKLISQVSKDSHEQCRQKSQRLMLTIRQQSQQIKNMHFKILQNERRLRQYAQN